MMEAHRLPVSVVRVKLEPQFPMDIEKYDVVLVDDKDGPIKWPAA